MRDFKCNQLIHFHLVNQFHLKVRDVSMCIYDNESETNVGKLIIELLIYHQVEFSSIFNWIETFIIPYSFTFSLDTFCILCEFMRWKGRFFHTRKFHFLILFWVHYIFSYTILSILFASLRFNIIRNLVKW